MSADLDNDNHICDYELQELLKSAGHDVPGYKLREIMQSLDRNKDNQISFKEFLAVRTPLSLWAVERRWAAFSPQWLGLCFASWPVGTSPCSTGLLMLRHILASARRAAAPLKSPRKKKNTRIRAQGMWKWGQQSGVSSSILFQPRRWRSH